LSEFVEWVRYLSQFWPDFAPKRWAAMAMERLANLSEEVTEGRNSVRVEEERVERDGWIIIK